MFAYFSFAADSQNYYDICVTELAKEKLESLVKQFAANSYFNKICFHAIDYML